MKHIQKIVKITIILREFGWDEESIFNFIMNVSNYVQKLRFYNEMLLDSKYSNILKLREDVEKEALRYISNQIRFFGYNPNFITFSHNVMECPIKMDLGVNYANYEDNKSFVIDL